MRPADRLATFAVTALSAAFFVGCEQLPEEFLFVNETPSTVYLGFGDVRTTPKDKLEPIAPAATYRYAQRPVALHPGLLGDNIDDEEQFRYLLSGGVTLLGEDGHGDFFDVPKLRTQMRYTVPRKFTLRIQDGFLAPRPSR